MKLLSTEQARAIWYFTLADINPNGILLLNMLNAMVVRYKFADLPNITDVIKNKKTLVFGQGAFQHPQFGEIGLDVAVYNDAIFSDTRTSTDASEAFIVDFFKWAEAEFGLKSPQNVRKQFVSRVFVEMDKEMNSLNPKLEKFCSALSKKAGIFGNPKYQYTGMTFGAEQANNFAPATFRFERAENVPLAQNRYYSFGAMPTSDHTEMLEMLEELFTPA